MTTLTSSTSAAGETALQREQQSFRELLSRLLDDLLNRLFDLRPEKAVRRMRYLVFFFLVSLFLVSLRYYPLPVWGALIQDIFSYLFSQSPYLPNYDGNPFANLLSYGSQVLVDPRILQYFPIFFASFFIALQSAAIYLADVFELEDVSVARRFVSEVALSGSDETIRITQGDIFEEHRSSPNYLIGGPGKVVVDLDSVALFEKPDGTPRVIGPTGKEPGGKATLDGFERFRQAIDLRDHYIELRDQTDKSSSVKSRSRDGILITASDVRFMFSVHREAQKSDDKNPYSFSKKAIEQLIYRATSRVTPDLTNPSTYEFSWINNMDSLIRKNLGGFMGEHNLTEYLASVGKPEFDKAEREKQEIAEKAKSLASVTTDDSSKNKDDESSKDKKTPEFQSRDKVKNLFDKFADEFTKSAHERGVELHWIGVGTWNTPLEVVSEKHLEAWKISRENHAKGSDGAIKKLVEETTIQETIALIQDVPIGAHQKAVEDYPDRKEHKKAMHAMLLEYKKQLMKALEFINAKAVRTPEDQKSARAIRKAIENINDTFGHFV